MRAVQAHAHELAVLVVAHRARLTAQLGECFYFLRLHVINAARGQPCGTLGHGVGVGLIGGHHHILRALGQREYAAANLFAVL